MSLSYRGSWLDPRSKIPDRELTAVIEAYEAKRWPLG